MKTWWTTRTVSKAKTLHVNERESHVFLRSRFLDRRYFFAYVCRIVLSFHSRMYCVTQPFLDRDKPKSYTWFVIGSSKKFSNTRSSEEKYDMLEQNQRSSHTMFAPVSSGDCQLAVAWLCLNQQPPTVSQVSEPRLVFNPPSNTVQDWIYMKAHRTRKLCERML